ncbi:LysM peptidoglycan-binding domain-containing protein, partial [Telmatospirillum sp.]|uniref:LysM peptidoglycan-binding domain-containing protein n=1 Tax=Telmatospirillum sp. TaxID=2079197 RepID=UPI002845A3F5
NRTSVTDGRGNTTYSYYDGDDRLVLSVDADGFATRTAYYATGQVASVTHYATAVSGTYNATTQPTTSASSNDATTKFTYDAAGRLTATTDAAGYAESYGLDAFGDRTQVTNKIGGVTTYTYDAKGNLLTETMAWATGTASTLANGTAESATVTNAYGYDAFSNRILQVEAQGLAEARTTTYVYDNLNRLTSQSVSLGAQGYASTLYQYDGNGNVVQSTDPNSNKTYSYYDALNRKTAQINALGVLTTYAYDNDSNLSTETVYATPLTLVAGTTPTPTPPSGGSRTTIYSYDSANRLIGTTVLGVTTGGWNGSTYVINPAVGVIPGVADPNGSLVTRQTVYDAAGNVIESIDGNGNKTYNYYDANGNKIAQVDPDSYLTTYSYDANGNVTQEYAYANKVNTQSGSTVTLGTSTAVAALVGSSGTSSLDRITQFTYDKNGNRLTETRLNVAAATAAGTSDAIASAPTTLTTTNGATSVSFTGTPLYLNQVISGPGVAAGTIVASVNTASGTAILSTAATASGMFNVNTSSETVLTTTSGSTTVNFIGGVPSVGQSVSGTGIASGTTITAVNAAAGTATLSAAATASSSIVIFSTSLLTAVSGSTTVSYSGIAPYVGEVISGIGIAAGTTITSVNTAAGTATLSVAATASGSINLNPQAETTLAITSGLTTATYTGLPLSVGQPVTGVGIPAGTTVVAVNPSTGSATLSAAATATGSTIVLANSTITYTYNALGEVISKREATGDTTAYVYDSQGRLTTTTTATGQVTNEGYDGLNDVTRSVSSGAKSAPRTTTYTYGPGGRLASMTGAGINAPAGAGVTGPQLTTWYTYDLAGNLIQQSQVRNAVDFAGAVADIQTIYQYDALNRQISQQSSYLSEVTQGSATGATWVAGDTDGVIYNAYGAVAATTVNGTRTTQFVYDNAGHLIASNSGDGTWKAYVTDANGNATLTIQSLGATDLSTLISSGMSGGLDISAFSQANQAIALQLATNNGANAAFAAQGISVTTTTGSTTISYSGGALYAGEAISGAGIPAGTTIVSVNAAAGSATLSAAATASGTFAPGASVTTVNGSTAISYSGGALYVGEAISGTGIPAGAKIASVNASAGTATLSVAATASGTITVGAPVGTSLTTTSGSATVSYVGSLWVGEPISGVGIPAGATVASINAAAGTAALSVPATASGTIVVGVEETIGIFDSRNQQVQTIQTQRQIDATGDLYAITTSQAYNAFGDMVSQTDARGNATTYQYNTLDKLTAQISPQVAIASGNGSTSAGNPITYNYYDISGRLIATRDADGNLTTQVLQAGTGYGGAKALAAAVYHPDGGIVQATYDVYGDALTQTDAVGNVTSNIYDNSGNLIEVDHPVATLNTTNGSANVTFSGGALQVGEPITAAGIPAGAVVVSVSGNTATLSAAATATGTVQVAGQLINSYSYDGLGEQVSQSNNLMTPGTLTGQPATFGQNGSGGAETFTVTLPTNPNMKSGSIVVSATNLASGVTLTGSVSGGVLTLNYSDTASGGNGGGNANFTLTQNGNILYQGTVSGIYFAKNDYYNISGQVQAVYAASGVQTTAYDAQGRVISTTDYMGYTVNYAYQWNGALATNGLGTYGGWTKTTTDVDAGETSSDTTDAFGHEITKTDLGGQIYSFTYNKAGELVAQSTSNPLNAIQILGVNASLTAGQKVYSQNSQFYLTYQTDGNLVVYGPGGAVLWASGTSGNAPRDAIMQDDGNLVVYNSSGSPNWASGTVNNSGATLFLTNNGQLEIISATKSLVWSTPAYSTPVGGTGGENLKYAYYNTGKIASITDNSNAITGYYGTTLNSKFTYDQNGNRLNTNYTSTNVSYAIYGINYGVTTTVLENATATYDALNRVTSVTDPGTSSRPSYTQTKTYDANGNIIENKTVHQNIGTTQALTAATTDDYWYAYDAMNRVVISEGDLSGAAGAAGTQVAIDIAGSMGGANILARTGQTAGTAIAYNADGQEISSTTKTSQSVFHNVRYSKYDTQSVLVGTYAQEIEQLYAYNAQGYLVSTSVAENSATINGTGASATLTVNALGTPAIQSTETRDALGRVLTQNEYDTAVEANSNMFGTPSATGAPGTIIYSETYAYNNDSQIVSSQVSDIQDSATSGVTNTVTTTYYNYGSVVAGGSANATSYADGNVISQTQNSTTYTGATGTASPSSTTVVTNNVYLWLDSAQLASITATYSGAQSGTTASTFDYDRNGHVSEVVTTGTNAHTNTYTESAAGLIMENNEISSSNGSSAPETFYFYLDDQQIGQIGNNGTTNVNYTTSINNQTNVSGGSGAFSGGASAGTSTANFDANYNAINATGNGSAPAGSSYTVQSGQTLQSIAASVYGDSNLWYVIADANGLSGSSNLTAGTVLTLPNTVENAGNTASTFKPYNANAALGDVQPGAPIPPAQ